VNGLSQTLLLIDGNSIINRAYFGMAGRSTMTAPDKTPTGALYAFLSMYMKYHQELNPDLVLVCFDLKAPTFRHQRYEGYKATRKPMPEDLAVQIPLLKEILDAMGIPRVEMEGYEADDLIGSAAHHAGSLGWHTFILSGDKDDLQLVNNDTTLLIPFTKSTGTITETFDPAAVQAKYLVHPDQFVELKAIMGDPSDNIPGVKGIGEKGATDLIVRYGTLEGIYASINEIKGTTATKLMENREMAFLSRELSAIRRDIDLSSVLDTLQEKKPDEKRMFALFTRLGFRSMISRFRLSGTDSGVESERTMHTVKEREILPISGASLIDRIHIASLYRLTDYPKSPEALCLDSGIPTAYFTEALKGIITLQGERFLPFYPVSGERAILDIGDTMFYGLDAQDYPVLFDWCSRQGIRLASFGLKQVFRRIGPMTNELMVFDIAVAGYLLNQSDSEPDFEKIASRTLDPGDFNVELFEETPTPAQQSLFDPQTGAEDAVHAVEKAKYALSVIHRVVDRQFQLLAERKQLFLALFVEMPLVRILADMENAGFRIDHSVLSELSRSFQQQIDQIEETIHEHAGGRFNINSPKQLGEILFTKLGLPSGKKSQNGFSTNADVLDMLYDKHPIIRDIIRYRELTKLRSTFLEGLAKSIDPSDGRVHTTFHQTLTTTGRLSSSNPNMQNIPIKTTTGREIRKAFVAEDGYVLIDADYSQIELRLLADFSGDEQMTEAFRDFDDIHMRTAEEIFDLPRAMITSTMRSAAKTINFSIVYGISDFSLAKDLNISLAQAHLYIEEYHKKYPKVKPYLSRLLTNAYADGYVETLFRRRRPIDELKSENRNLRSFGERAAMNAPVQGTAADIIKIAMVLLDRRLRSEQIGARLVLQVHDELILEVAESHADKAATMLRESMEQAIHLSVPLIAEVSVQKNWFGEQ
jgi:DNA polymerase I